MKKIRVAIIGQGRSGRNIHARNMANMKDKFKVVAVCDQLPGRCDKSKEEFGCDTYTDYRKMMKRDDIDLMINATTSEQHVSVTLKLLDAGFNVLTEKPLARRAADVDKIIKKAKETGKFFAIYQQSRFAAYFQKVKEVINSGVLGRIVMIKVAFNGFARRWDWQTLQDMNAGNLLNTGPHPLDQALNLFGDADPDVFCLMDRANCFGDAEDHVKLILSKKGHPTIDMEVSSCCAYPLYTYQVYGTQGGLTGNMNHFEWKFFKPSEAPKQKLIKEPLPELAYCSETLKWHSKQWDASPEEADVFTYAGTRFYNNIYNALVKGTPLEVTPQQVRRQIAVIEKAHKQNPFPKLKKNSPKK